MWEGGNNEHTCGIRGKWSKSMWIAYLDPDADVSREGNTKHLTKHAPKPNDLEIDYLMPRPHQTFRPILIVKLMGIMLRNRCWATTFHTIIIEDVDGWC